MESDSSGEDYDDHDTVSNASEEAGHSLDPGDPNMSLNQYLTCQPDTPAVLDNDNLMQDNAPAPPRAARVSNPKCWLCTFSPHPVAVEMHNFVIANVSSMDFQYIASQIKDEIKGTFPHAAGARRRDITRHITQHMIAPQVKIAATIRSLVTVADTLKAGLTHRDPDTNEILVDIKNSELFLKFTAQLLAAYKVDSTKLLFGKPAGQG
jgi:hypothetical protein